MDRETKRDWKWLPQFMPKVAALIADRKKQDGEQWVQECWRRGVVLGEPGHFWAAEGPIAIGTPIAADLVNRHYELAAKYPGTATFDMARKPE